MNYIDGGNTIKWAESIPYQPTIVIYDFIIR